MQFSRDQDKREKDLKSITPRTIPAVISIVGYSGSGKTTLIEKLISSLKQSSTAHVNEPFVFNRMGLFNCFHGSHLE